MVEGLISDCVVRAVVFIFICFFMVFVFCCEIVRLLVRGFVRLYGFGKLRVFFRFVFIVLRIVLGISWVFSGCF